MRVKTEQKTAAILGNYRRSEMGWYKFSAGRLTASGCRSYLESEKFIHEDFEFIESKGFWRSDFTIKGNEDALRRIDRDVTAHIEKMEAAKEAAK